MSNVAIQLINNIINANKKINEKIVHHLNSVEATNKPQDIRVKGIEKKKVFVRFFFPFLYSSSLLSLLFKSFSNFSKSIFFISEEDLFCIGFSTISIVFSTLALPFFVKQNMSIAIFSF
jgi:hypothetical protein